MEKYRQEGFRPEGLYRPCFEHDACGIGAVVDIKGRKSHQTLDDSLKIVEKLEHRAGKDAEGRTGDGAGILLQVSHRFFEKAAKAAGIPVCNIPTYGTTAVAQFAMALLLELCHHVADHSRSVKAGDWSRCPDFCYWNTPLIELAGKTFGVIGYGRIGQATARLAAAFGMEVLACDAYAKPCPPARLTTLEEVLEKSDVISLHCPLTPETQGIINRETLDRMKDGVFLLNTSRGPLVDEAALADALAGGKVAGAGLDVLAVEPPLADNPLMARPNCLITPHIAWAPKESRQRLMDVAVANLKAWLNGAPQNVVNP